MGTNAFFVITRNTCSYCLVTIPGFSFLLFQSSITLLSIVLAGILLVLEVPCLCSSHPCRKAHNLRQRRLWSPPRMHTRNGDCQMRTREPLSWSFSFLERRRKRLKQESDGE